MASVYHGLVPKRVMYATGRVGMSVPVDLAQQAGQAALARMRRIMVGQEQMAPDTGDAANADQVLPGGGAATSPPGGPGTPGAPSSPGGIDWAGVFGSIPGLGGLLGGPGGDGSAASAASAPSYSNQPIGQASSPGGALPEQPPVVYTPGPTPGPSVPSGPSAGPLSTTVVATPWYKKWWVLLLGAVAAAVAGYYGVKYYQHHHGHGAHPAPHHT